MTGPTQDPRIIPSSLRETLDAHRATNLAKRIRKHATLGRDLGVIHPRINYTSPEDAADKAGVSQQRASGVLPHHPDQAGYTGRPASMLVSWRPQAEGNDLNATCPWMRQLSKSDLETPINADRMNSEVEAFADYLSLTSTEKDVTKAVYHGIVRDCGISPDGAHMLGSQETGLAVVTSDIDINIGAATGIKTRMLGERGPSPGRPEVRKRSQDLLRSVWRILGQKRGIYYLDFVHAARIPIIHGTHVPTGIDFDIQATFDQSVTTHVQDYLHEYPAIRPLHIVIRHFLRMHGLNERGKGGLSSYATFVMILAIFKLNGGKYKRGHTVEPLMDFLEFYSKIDFWFDGVSADPFAVFPKRPQGGSKLLSTGVQDHHDQGRHLINIRNSQYPYFMCLQDPADPSNDLGKGTTDIKHIQATFWEKYQLLQGNLILYQKSNADDRSRMSIMQPILAGNYRRFEHNRAGLTMGWSKQQNAVREPTRFSHPAVSQIKRDQGSQRQPSYSTSEASPA